MERVLEGVRVLDFSRFLAGPYCGLLLAVMGAEVVRVESPGGDIDRELGPFTGTGESMYPWLFNYNKKGITLDLQTATGVEVLADLVRVSDVVIEAFRPGAKPKGLEYDALQAVNPTIVLVSVSGFGQTGPYAKRGGFDAIAQGMAGIMSITGFPDGTPTKSGPPVADYGTGMYGALGAVLALYHRERSGVGQIVDVSLLDTALSFMESAFAEHELLGETRPRIGNRRPFSAPTDMFKAKDGYVNLSVSSDSLWRRFCTVVDRKDLVGDPRFKSGRTRFRHHAFLNALAAEWVSQRTVAEVMQAMEKVGIPCGPVYSVPEVLADPHVKAREMVLRLHHPDVGDVPIPAVPIKLSRTPITVQGPAPRAGADNDEVYCGLLGYSAEELTALKEGGVV